MHLARCLAAVLATGCCTPIKASHEVRAASDAGVAATREEGGLHTRTNTPGAEAGTAAGTGGTTTTTTTTTSPVQLIQGAGAIEAPGPRGLEAEILDETAIVVLVRPERGSGAAAGGEGPAKMGIHLPYDGSTWRSIGRFSSLLKSKGEQDEAWRRMAICVSFPDRRWKMLEDLLAGFNGEATRRFPRREGLVGPKLTMTPAGECTLSSSSG